MVHIYCGDGKGKTTAATGLTVRALGCDKKVLFVQFFKNGTSGEIKILKTLPNLTYLKTEQSFHRFALMNDAEKTEANKCYHALLEEAIAKADAFDMVVLDEVISCYNYGYLQKEALHAFCARENAPEIVLTGRGPSDELIALADYVSELHKMKHPFDKGQPARRGVEF